jgi:hypothetical protein
MSSKCYLRQVGDTTCEHSVPDCAVHSSMPALLTSRGNAAGVDTQHMSGDPYLGQVGQAPHATDASGCAMLLLLGSGVARCHTLPRLHVAQQDA